MELRDYQKECIEAIDSLKSGSGLVSMATGLGKTVVFSHINRKGRVLILSHREELVHQPLKYYSCPCGVEQANEHSNGEEVVSASVQSLTRRLDKFKPDDFDIIITDEAHHAAAPSYKKILAYFKPRLHIGFTATPNRGDKVRLDDVYDKIIFERNLKWGIENDYLSDIRCLRVNVTYNLSRVGTRMGDFAANELDKAINTEAMNKEIAEVYNKYANGQTLIFASSVSHAENIASLIKGAVVVSQKTPNRQEIIEKFTKRIIPCIVNCMIFTEGTDMPLIETVIIARPTANSSLYTQMVGRGLRKYEGKKYLTLIDCVGITGKLDICTAPTLMGLDIENVPKYKREELVGMLTDMPNIIEKARDCPEIWTANIQTVRLFASEQKVNIRDINWTKKGNGDLVYQSSGGDRIGIKAIDELGKTFVMQYCYNHEKDAMVYTESEEMNLQKAIDTAYSILEKDYGDERKLWDLKEYYLWQFEQASDKQLELIKNRLSKNDFEALTMKGRISKGDAAQIINMLMVRGVSKNRLLELARKKYQDKQLAQEEKERRSLLKIRYIIDKSIKVRKYYALQLQNDLIITNNWNNAKDIIADCENHNEQIKYKKFETLESAIAFLKN